MTETPILPVTSDDGTAVIRLPATRGGWRGGCEPPQAADRQAALAGAVVIAAAAFLLLHGGSSSALPATVIPRGTPHAVAPVTRQSRRHTAKTTTLPKKAKANPRS